MIFTGADYADEEPVDAEEQERRQSSADEAKYDMIHEDEEYEEE